VNIQIEAFYWESPKEPILKNPRVELSIGAQIPILDVWILLPEKKGFQSYQLVKFAAAEPALAKTVRPDDGLETSTGTVIRWTLLEPDSTARYECRWEWAH
jgi:hypothetical protein